MLGPAWVGARRFGIQQGGKIRVIDDFSEFMINAAFGSSEKVSIPSLDHVVNKARAWHESVSNGQINVLDARGFRHCTRLHWQWGNKFTKLLGRITDL
eukprot:5516685-Karenia_brevis.AAC.1